MEAGHLPAVPTSNNFQLFTWSRTAPVEPAQKEEVFFLSYLYKQLIGDKNFCLPGVDV